MSLIFGNPANEKQTVSAALSARGINVLRCHISEMRLYSMPTIRQVAYSEYIAHLPGFMWSCVEQKKADLRQPGHPVKIAMTECIPIRNPNISVSPSEKGAEKHSALLDLGGKMEKIRGTNTYQFPRPKNSTIRDVLKIGIDKKCQAADEFINLAAFDSFKTTIKIISSFLLVQRYPAFIDHNHLSSHYDGFAAWAPENEKQSGEKRKKPVEELVDAGSSPKRSRRVADGDVEMAENTDTHVDAPNPRLGQHDGDAVIRIKTIPGKAIQPWITSPSDLPSYGGIWSPFISQTQFYDTDFVPSVVDRFFLGCLGSSRDACLLGMEIFKADWGVLGKSEAGKELTHVMACIKLAIPAQARVVPIISEKVYLGCAIMGYGFSLMVGGKSYKPVTRVELLRQIDDTVTHKKVLGKILAMLGLQGSVEERGSQVYGLCVDPEFSMMRLHNLCISQAVAETVKLQISELARALDFRQVTWATNASSLSKALDLISNIGEPLPDDLPLHHSVLFKTDRLSLVWSSFGFDAPTFRPIASKLVAINAKTYTVLVPVKGGEKKTEERVFDHFHVRHVVLDQAIEDLRTVRESGKVGIFANPQREADNANRRLDKEDFVKVRDSLFTLCSMSKDKGKDREEVLNEHAADMIEIDDDDLADD